jgi:hypothetical protein
LWRQRRHNLRIEPVKIAIPVKPAFVATGDSPCGQFLSYASEKPFAVNSAFFSIQFKLMDTRADKPVPQGQGRVDRLGSAGVGPLMNVRDALNQGIEIHRAPPANRR